MEETLLYLSVQGLYGIDSANGLHLLSAADKWRKTHRFHHWWIHQCPEESLIVTVSQRYIICEKLMCMGGVEVSNRPQSEMHQKFFECPTLNSYSVYIWKRTGHTQLVDWRLNMIRIYTYIVYLLYFTMGCDATINLFSALRLLSGCSVGNESGPSLLVRVLVESEPLGNWHAGLWIHPNCQLGYGSMEFS